MDALPELSTHFCKHIGEEVVTVTGDNGAKNCLLSENCKQGDCELSAKSELFMRG